MKVLANVQADWFRREVVLQVAIERHDGRYDVLMSDSSWQSMTQEEVIPASGLVLPPEALPAIAQAITVYLGKELPSVAEVSVLREWLTVERQRVDAVLTRVQDPMRTP